MISVTKMSLDDNKGDEFGRCSMAEVEEVRIEAIDQGRDQNRRVGTAYQDMASMIGGIITPSGTGAGTAAADSKDDIGDADCESGRRTGDCGSGSRVFKADDDDDITEGENALLTLTGHIGDDNQYEYKAASMDDAFSGKCDIRDILYSKYKLYSGFQYYNWIFGDPRYMVPK